MKQTHEHVKEKLELMKDEKSLSPLEMIKRSGGVAHPVKTESGRAADSMLAVYRERCTYTFMLDKEVASIHFDKLRHEIFFKGHNIANIELKPEQIKALKAMQQILSEDEQGKLLFNEYVATLGHALADKYNKSA